MNFKRFLLPAVASLALCTGVDAQQPYGGCWHPDDIKDWSPETDPDAKFNRARVPLAKRFREPELMKATATQWYEGQITNATILHNTCSACPSQGADNFLGYQPTYWQYVDKLVYWAGSASEGIIIPPPAPSVDAAHQAGVKVLGQIFFPPGAYGGDPKWVSQMLTQEDGKYIYAIKLYEIAKYLGFDGWFINEETNLGLSTKWPDFVKEFNRIADENGDTHFEIQWYNASTRPNINILKAHKNTSQFLEYGSAGNNLYYADDLECTEEETFSKLYGGIECVRAGLTGYSNSLSYAFYDDRHVGSIALFCPEEHSWKDQVKNYLGTADACGPTAYYAIEKVFNNEEKVWVNEDADPSVKASDWGWRGISSHILERSSIDAMPFVSNMCVGVGKHRFVDGEKQGTQDWYHSGVQSILPTWRWWFEKRGDLKVKIDWDDAYNHGSSFKISGTLSGENMLRLYKTMIPVKDGGTVRVVFKGGNAPELKLSTTSSVNPDVTIQAKTSTKNGWTVAEYDLASVKGKTIYMIALNLKGSGKYEMNLGQIAVLPKGYSPKAAEIKNLKLDANLGEEKGDIRVSWDFDWSNDFDHFDVYTVDMTGKRTLVGQTRGEAFYIAKVMRNGIDTKLDVQVVPVMKNMVQGEAAVASADYPAPTAPRVTFKLSKSYLKVGETSTITAFGTGAPTAWKWTLPAGLELVGGKLTDNVITVKGVKEGRYTVAISATNSVGTSETRRDIIDVYSEESYGDVTNVVKNKTVVGFSTSANSTEVPTKIIDGVRSPFMTSSKWCCTTPNNWVIFDMEGLFRVYGFGIWDCKAGPEDAENFDSYTIELSLDGENWTTVVDEEGRGSDDIKYDNIAPIRARYVRLSPHNTAVLRIWEFEVYGISDVPMTATVDTEALSLKGGESANITVTYDLQGTGRDDSFGCEVKLGQEIATIGEVTENTEASTFTIPVTALDVIGETDITIVVRNGSDYSELKAHLIVDSDNYPNVLVGRTAKLRCYSEDYSSVAAFKEYTNGLLTDGDTEKDACLDIEEFSTHKDDFWAIFEAGEAWTISKVRVHLPNGNKGVNDNDKEGFVNNEISIAVGNNLDNLTIVKTFSELQEVSNLECILSTPAEGKYIAIICNLNAFFYPAMAEVEAFGSLADGNHEAVNGREPVAVANWSADVIAEALPAADHTDATLGDGWVLYSDGVQPKGAIAGENRTIVSAQGTRFELAAYDAANALVLGKDALSGNIELAEEVFCKDVRLLVISNGAASLDVTVNYADGSASEKNILAVESWNTCTPDAAKTGLGRVADEIDARCLFQVFEKTVAADAAKAVKSISVESKDAAATTAVLAVARTISEGTGIAAPEANVAEIEAIYNLQGVRVSGKPAPGVYIIRYTDGTARKAMIK